MCGDGGGNCPPALLTRRRVDYRYADKFKRKLRFLDRSERKPVFNGVEWTTCLVKGMNARCRVVIKRMQNGINETYRMMKWIIKSEQLGDSLWNYSHATWPPQMNLSHSVYKSRIYSERGPDFMKLISEASIPRDGKSGRHEWNESEESVENAFLQWWVKQMWNVICLKLSINRLLKIF